MSQAEAVARRSTPGHLWLVGTLALLWNAFGAYVYVLTETHDPSWTTHATPEQIQYYTNLPAWSVACWAVGVWGGVVGSLLLLLRKRLAVTVFLLSLLGVIGTRIYVYALSNGLEVEGGATDLALSAAIFVIAVALWLYARAMRRGGVLA